MNKLIVALCTGVMLVPTGSVLAKDQKESICHNGSTYYVATLREVDSAVVVTVGG